MKFGNSVSGVILVCLLIGCGAPDTPSQAPVLQHGEVQWFEGDVEEAFASAKDSGKPVFLYWGAVWCPPCHNLKVNYSGFMYGGGATLAFGGKGWFATVTYDLTETDLDIATSSVSAWVLTPRVGLTFKSAAIWVGAMYQNAEETHEGVWEMPFLGAVPYSAVLEQSEPWNYQIGMIAGLGEHWNLNFEGGVGNRKSVLAALEYRFGSR